MAYVPHDPKRFADFKIKHVDYKVVKNHPIPLSILVPKKILDPAIKKNGDKKKYPLAVQFHGGFLVGGARLYSEWFPAWLIQLALDHSAILISPDYRLLPEHSGPDILDDLADFWTWIRTALNEDALADAFGVRADLDRLLVAGQSAGGWLAAQSVLLLLQPELDVKALVLTYPMLHLRTRFWGEAYEKVIFGVPNLPSSIIDEHMRAIDPDAVVTTDGDPMKGERFTRSLLAIALAQHGRLLDRLGSDTALFPVENVPRASTLPRFVWIFHGREDSAVPFEGSEVFVRALRERNAPGTTIRFDACAGDHGFDAEVSVERDEWFREGVEELRRFWP